MILYLNFKSLFISATVIYLIKFNLVKINTFGINNPINNRNRNYFEFNRFLNK